VAHGTGWCVTRFHTSPGAPGGWFVSRLPARPLPGWSEAARSSSRAACGAPAWATVPDFDTSVNPEMAALAPFMAGFGSVTESGRMPGTVLAGIRTRAAR
jgi:hypothetical protein